MYDAHHKGISYNIFFVLKGLVDGEEGVSAQKSGTGAQLADGWYYLVGDDVDGDGPHEFREEAEHYAEAAIEADQESQMYTQVDEFVARLTNFGWSHTQVEEAFKEALKEV